MLDIRRLPSDSAKCRKVFHSEADFLHTPGWQSHQTMSVSQIRSAYPMSAEHRKMYVDIWLPLEKIAIEPK